MDELHVDPEATATGVSRQRNLLDWTKLMHLFQILTVAVSAGWIFYQYRQYQSHANELALDQARLQLEQTKETNRLTALDIQRREQDRALKDIELRYAERRTALDMLADSQAASLQRIQLQFASQLGELSVQDQTLEVAQSSIALEKARTRKLDYTLDDLDVTHLGEAGGGLHRFRAVLSLTIKNHSEKPVEVTYTAIEGFIGELPDPDIGRPSIIRPGLPPSLFRRQTTSAASWERISGEMYRTGTAPSYPPIYVLSAFARDFPSVVGGGATGVWSPGEEARFTHVYQVVANPTALVAFVTSMCLDQCNNPKDFWDFRHSIELSSVLEQARENPGNSNHVN